MKASPKAAILFGTRPEAIKLAPVIIELIHHGFAVSVVNSEQHTDLVLPVLRDFGIVANASLNAGQKDQTTNDIARRVIQAFDDYLKREKPDFVIVQGDTTTAFAGAFAAFNRRIPVFHVEAGLRSGNDKSPFPEEMNRKLISQIAALNFAATALNRENLLREGVAEEKIYITGNTIVDALLQIRQRKISDRVTELSQKADGRKIVLLTTHRRENFGDAMRANLVNLKRFAASHKDVCIIFPVHPNPSVRTVANEIFSAEDSVFLTEPLNYNDFVHLMDLSWLIVSDSGGVQEEAPTLGKALLVLRENTERPEAIEAGTARLVKNSVFDDLTEIYQDPVWIEQTKAIPNPFGDGTAAQKIAEIIEKRLQFDPGN